MSNQAPRYRAGFVQFKEEKDWYQGKSKAQIDSDIDKQTVDYGVIMDELIESNKVAVVDIIVRSFFDYYRRFKEDIMQRIKAGEYNDDVCFNNNMRVNALGIKRVGNNCMRTYFEKFHGRGYSLSQFDELIKKCGEINAGFTIRRIKLTLDDQKDLSEAASAAKAELIRLDKEQCDKVAAEYTEIEKKVIADIVKEKFAEFYVNNDAITADSTEKENEFKKMVDRILIEQKADIDKKIDLHRCATMYCMDDNSDKRAQLHKIIEKEEQSAAKYRYVMQICFSTCYQDFPIAPYKPIVDLTLNDLKSRGFTVSNQGPHIEVKKCAFEHNHKTKEYWGFSVDDKDGDVLSVYIDL